MLHLQQVIIAIVFLAAFISHVHEAIAQFQPRYSSFFAPIHKHTDAAVPLYSVQIMTDKRNSPFKPTNFFIDVDAPLTWHDCIVKPDIYQGTCPDNVLCTLAVACDEDLCPELRNSYSSKHPYCQRIRNTTIPPDGTCPCPIDEFIRIPGGYCPCTNNVNNPLDWPCHAAFLNYDNFFVNTTNGRNPIPDGLDYASTNAACAPSSSFQYFPADVTGVVALSSSPYSFVSSLDMAWLNKTFSLCLPSTSAAPGIFFYGNGPYYLRPHSDVDVRSFLSYTPLLKHPASFGYFIGVSSIEIKKRSIDIPANATTKFSTFEPYTTLRTDIYNYVIRRFSLVTKQIPPTNPVSPFGLCFNTSTNGTKVGLKVPDINFNLQGGKKWSISTANSMKQITEEVACLAFVDGGATSEHAIVIGTFQFEDNFLLFDLQNSNLGFSSSLLRKQTSCSNFNFTMAW
uniref:chitinase CLP-like n=1 Tax=Erigeron canadensis TaxID=72917 RepID=UPI001CB99552|nr:chitinase CLP-like [Erigeron canadensis]